jgi:hypothetical protein
MKIGRSNKNPSVIVLINPLTRPIVTIERQEPSVTVKSQVLRTGWQRKIIWIINTREYVTTTNINA